MTTLASYFADAMGRIEPENDAKNAQAAHKQVSDVLRGDKGLIELGVDPVLIGSYARHVSIRRIKDVDVFARLSDADDQLRPSRAMDLFERALEPFGSRVERQARSFKVEFAGFDLTVDVVPARREEDHWQIPQKIDQDNRASWIPTNPLRLKELTTEKNQDERYLLNDRGLYVPTVKLVRQIRRVWIGDHPGGFFFEVMTYWAFENSQPRSSSRAECLVDVLDQLVAMLPDVRDNGLDDPTMPGRKIHTRADEADFERAINGITKAANKAHAALTEDEDCLSALSWRELLGETTEGDHVFPMPEYCNADGTRRNTESTTSGARTSPAGDGRYA